MTKEEAIKILQNPPRVYDEKMFEALDVAIEALSANCTTEKPNDIVEPKNDAVDYISRSDAMAYIDRVINSGLGRNKSLDYIRKYISALPSAEQKEEELAKDIARRMATIIENEQDMRVILKNASADRPTELLKDGTLKVNVKNGAEVNRVLVWGDDGSGGLYYADDRPSGEWVCKDSADMSVFWFECSECGELTPRDNFNHEYKSNYCPNCGAKMGGNK